ncbi:MAG: L-threonylcarbamoyladenylate synthase [bacterium]
MKLIDKEYVENNQKEIIKAIQDGLVFIYPTDTIYGIGTNATKDDFVMKIRTIKQRETKPFSVIAPNIDWIKENCETDKETEKWLEKLPGRYTLFLDLKNTDCISDEVNPLDDSIGVRIPQHWFTEIIEKSGIPFITTSANISGQSYMRKIEDLDEDIKNSVDYIIYEGEKIGKESEKVDLRKNLD